MHTTFVAGLLLGALVVVVVVYLMYVRSVDKTLVFDGSRIRIGHGGHGAGARIFFSMTPLRFGHEEKDHGLVQVLTPKETRHIARSLWEAAFHAEGGVTHEHSLPGDSAPTPKDP